MKKSPVRAVFGEVFCHESEDLEKVSKAFELFFPKKEIKQNKQEVSLGINLIVLTSEIKKKKAKDLARKILDSFSKLEKKQMLDELSRRLSEEGKFYLRFNKQIAFEEEKMCLAKETEDSIQIVFSLEAFPANHTNFVNAAKELLLD